MASSSVRDESPLAAEDLVAHRGYAERYPENTRLALERAVEAGAVHLEFDVHLSSDRIPVVIHDRDLVRTAGRAEVVAERTAEELAATSVHEPERLGDRFEGEGVPRLSELVEWLEPQRHIHSFVEIKRKALAVWGRDGMVPVVVETLRPIRDRATVISFDLESAVAARALGAPSVGWVVETWDERSRVLASELAPEALFVDHRAVPDGVALWEGRWRWVVYEIVEVEHARALRRRGADLIETMAVGELIAGLE